MTALYLPLSLRSLLGSSHTLESLERDRWPCPLLAAPGRFTQRLEGREQMSDGYPIRYGR